MNFRRSEFDVTNRINTTDPVCVKLEVERIGKSLYGRPVQPALLQGFTDIARLYRGDHPAYAACDTDYHDIQHVLEVTLAMARLLDGYERSRGDGPAIGERIFQLGILCALFHDVGYLRKKGDKRHLHGAEYTTTHVTRGAKFLKGYLRDVGLPEYADAAANIVHFTGYERPVRTIRLVDPIYRLVGSLLGSADIIAQMSDRCYLEKCRDRLYPEFVAGGITRKQTSKGEVVVFASAEDLVRKTPGFYATAARRLDEDLGGAHQYAAKHFGGSNHYMDAVKRNVRFAECLGEGADLNLRRQPPATLN